ncbi:DUF4145 domain-containing protein [Rhizobium sp. CF122]|uniref:DUF4145 domain-containing protein n=1 Tax=Rhizobium sp. CF122 TaxID=1144312 RepID=UPI000691D233|nr:DUF4145 domain-containing protein [Rhizobium sp. CF122]
MRSYAKHFYRLQPQHVSTALSHLEMGGVSEGRFTCFLICDFRFCGEVVAVSGDYTSREEDIFNPETEEYDTYDDKTVVPRAMVPAPPIITWPEKLEAVPRQHLIQAFELFWMNRGACANRLRIFIETLLDQLAVAREGRKRNGKSGDLDLAERIDLLNETQSGHKIALDALRYVGNFGSHEGGADFDDLLDCFELIEHTLIELLDERSAKLQAKAKAIVSRKGKPKG